MIDLLVLFDKRSQKGKTQQHDLYAVASHTTASDFSDMLLQIA